MPYVTDSPKAMWVSKNGASSACGGMARRREYVPGQIHRSDRMPPPGSTEMARRHLPSE